MRDVEYCERALLDLRSIQLHYLLYASEEAAAKHVSVIMGGVDMIAEMPDLGAFVDDPKGMIAPGYRRYLARDFWIYYSVSSAGKITIWRIFHAKQNIDDYAFVNLRE